MTSQFLSLAAGTIITLLASYIPGFRVWFALQSDEAKSLMMAGALLVVSLVIFGAGCAHLDIPIVTTCDQAGAVGLATTFLTALIANQAVYHISPQTADVKVAKAAVNAKQNAALGIAPTANK